MWHPNSAEPRAELELLLQRLLILVVRGVFNDDNIITFANFSVLLRLRSAFPCACSSSCGGKGGTKMYFFRCPTRSSKHKYDYTGN
jgi:hypothetical protein